MIEQLETQLLDLIGQAKRDPSKWEEVNAIQAEIEALKNAPIVEPVPTPTPEPTPLPTE
jgi:hypothetical protein